MFAVLPHSGSYGCSRWGTIISSAAQTACAFVCSVFCDFLLCSRLSKSCHGWEVAPICNTVIWCCNQHTMCLRRGKKLLFAKLRTAPRCKKHGIVCFFFTLPLSKLVEIKGCCVGMSWYIQVWTVACTRGTSQKTSLAKSQRCAVLAVTPMLSTLPWSAFTLGILTLGSIRFVVVYSGMWDSAPKEHQQIDLWSSVGKRAISSWQLWMALVELWMMTKGSRLDFPCVQWRFCAQFMVCVHSHWSDGELN